MARSDIAYAQARERIRQLESAIGDLAPARGAGAATTTERCDQWETAATPQPRIGSRSRTQSSLSAPGPSQTTVPTSPTSSTR